MTVFDSDQDDFFIRETDELRPTDRDLDIKAVVFDLGGVLIANGPRLGVIARLLGRTASNADQDEVEAAIWKFRRDYDLGGSAQDSWRQVAEELGATDYDLSLVVAAEADRWAHPLPDAIDLLDQLEDAPVTVGALCNAPLELARVFDDQEWTEQFRSERFSGKTGTLVPDTSMFELVENDLHVTPSEVLFFDNNPEHVEAALAHGWDSHLWQGGEAAREVLVERGILD